MSTALAESNTYNSTGILNATLVAEASAAIAETNTYDSTDVPKATIDNGTITSTLTVPVLCDAQITDINVQINLDHTWLNDLDIFLIAPDGTTVELTTDNGGGSGSFTDTIFDDEAATLITAGTSPFTGSYQPEGSLAALDGKSRGGTWILQVTDDDIIADTGTLNSWSLTIETTDTTIPSSDTPRAIPDNGTTTSTITSCNTLKIVDVNVQLDITHSRDEDLDIFLIAPDGTRIELSTDNGGGGNHFTGTIFDDEAATSVTAGTAPFAGSFRPEEPLSVLDGMTANGTWTLEVSDDVSSFAGTLNSWRLIFGLIDPDYNLSTYVNGLSAQPAGLTVDPATGTLYFADSTCEGQLQKVAPDGAVSIVTSDFTPNGGPGCSGMFYPVISTDIQFVNGNVYVPLSDDIDAELVRIDTDSGTTVVEQTFAGFGWEGGLAVKNGLLLVTSGRGPATEIQSYNKDTRTAGLALDVSPLTTVMSVEYDRKNNATYFWSDGAFYRADLDAGTYSAIPSYLTARDDFVISPDSSYLIATNHPNIDLVSVVDGSSTTLSNALTFSSRHDMVLADSSSGGGCSLYIVDGTGILEISGFGKCRSFPWPMFLPAITNHSSP